MSLIYPFFQSNKRLQSAYNNNPPLRPGERGLAVALLQAALIDLGYPMPMTTSGKGFPDGDYGQETKNTVLKFQEKSKIDRDGLAGKQTIGKLDKLLMSSLPGHKPLIGKSLSSIFSAHDYKIGTDDPPVTPDTGAGPWNSKPKTMSAKVQKAAILDVIPTSIVLIGDNAAKHVLHYLGNTGKDLRIDLEGMINEVSSAKKLYYLEVDQAKAFVETLPVGTYDITSTKVQGGYNTKSESTNWFFAVGGYSVWGKGKATIQNNSTGREYSLEFEYKFYDRYNWDTGKKVDIFGIEVTDYFMGEFHRQGLAREYNEIGSINRHFIWKHGQTIPPGQHVPPHGNR